MILTKDQSEAIARHVQREGRQVVIDYHTAHFNGAKPHYSDPPSVAETKERLRTFHQSALEYVVSLPLPVARKHRGGGIASG